MQCNEPLRKLNGDSLSTSSLRRHHFASLVASKEHAQVRTSSQIAAEHGKLAASGRTLREECERYPIEIMLGSRHLVTQSRQELVTLREAGSAWASEVVANVDSFGLFGGTHVDVTLQTSLQVEGKLLGPPRPRGSEPKLGTPFLMQDV